MDGVASNADTRPFLGVHVASGIAYFGVSNRQGVPLMDDDLECIRPTAQLGDAERLDEFRKRVVQEIRRLDPAEVGIFRTTKYFNWTFKNAWARFPLEAAVMLAATDEQVPSRHVVAEDAARRAGGDKTKIPERAAAAWGVPPAKRYWKERALAFAAAVALACGEVR
jgi:hypothetical protein